jgi:hypothetical protein
MHAADTPKTKQRRGWLSIIRLVDKAVARGDQRHGRRLASLLATQLARLDALFGKSAARLPRPSAEKLRRYGAALRVILAAHPDWGGKRIAPIIGASLSATHKYLRVIRGAKQP